MQKSRQITADNRKTLSAGSVFPKEKTPLKAGII